MDLSSVLSLFVLCLLLGVPSALVRTLPTLFSECEDGESCVKAEDCSGDFRDQETLAACHEERVCCKTLSRATGAYGTDRRLMQDGFAMPRAQYLPSSRSKKAMFLLPDRSYSWPSEALFNTKYTADHNDNANPHREDIDIRIVNIQSSNRTNQKPTVSYSKATKYDLPDQHEENEIVFPENSGETSTEKSVDRLSFIKKLYQQYTVDFKKYNSNDRNEVLSKRRFKYAVGLRSAKYCRLYEQYTVENSLLAMPLLPSLLPMMMQHNHCSKPLPLIVGGYNATKGEFPHMAGLGYDRGEWIDFLCGGSLISEKYVLTAAHCTQTRWGPPIIVRLGTRNLITDVGQNMDVEAVVVHPGYREPSGYNDIALVKMVSGPKLSSTLRPACLPSLTTPAGLPGSYLLATGWGRTGFGLYSSPNLQKVSLKVMDNETCDQLFLGGRRTLRLPQGIQSTLLCAAGYLDSSHDTCQGDSGGPLQALSRHSKCMYEIVGITSFGKLCGTGLPAIYTRVSAYIHWIEDIVWPS